MGCLATISQQSCGQSAEFQGHLGTSRVSSFRTHDGWRVSGVENAIDMSQIQLVKHEDFSRNLGNGCMVVFLEAVATKA